MPYTLTRRPNYTVEIEATMDAAAVADERQGIVRSLRRRVQVPGFRPGKAPEAAVTARYRDEIQAELVDSLSERLWREVLDGEQAFEPLTRPHVHDAALDDAGGFRMTAHLEVRPRFELPDPAAASLPEVELEPSPAEIDAELEGLRGEYATWEPADDAVAGDGVLVEADLRGEVEGSDEDPYEEQGARFVLEEGSVPPEIREALQGATVGDRREAVRHFPADDDAPDSAEKTVRYTIDVTAIKRRQLPALDDGLAATIGLDSLAELRDKVGEMVARRKRAQRRESWRRAVLDHLEGELDANDLPSSLVQTAIREDLNRFAYTMAMRGHAAEVDSLDWNELSAKAEPAARRRVLDSLVLEQLAEAWQIAVPEAEVDAMVAAEAAQRGVPPGEHKANLAKEGRLEDIRHAARMSATVDELIRRAGGEVD